MQDRVNSTAGCLLVGEYVDEGDVPMGATDPCGEVIRPRMVATYVDGPRHAGPSYDLNSTFLKLLQQESDGPSRTQMMELVIKLQVVETAREVLQRDPSNTSVIRLLAELFQQKDETLQSMMAILDRLQPSKE